MTKPADLVLDAYERRARLTPGLFAAAPVIVTLVSLGLQENLLVAAALGVVSVGAGAFLLSAAVANLGRSTQDNLWRSWGGPPTVQLLRLRTEPTNVAQRDIWRASIQMLTRVSFLSHDEERGDPPRADDLITAAIDQVRYLGQDNRYPLVGRENAQYGLERNTYGARWIGRVLSLVGVLALGLIVVSDPPHSSTTEIVGLGLNAVLALTWFIIPSEKRMRDAAFRYGNQLLQAVVREERSNSDSKGKSNT